jgi:hypothetical protein
MRTIFFLSLGLALAVMSSPQATDTDTSYLQILSDVPLAPGLSMEDDSQVDFDTADGRIAEAVAFGPAELQAVKNFYQESLTALGWTRVSPKKWLFKRDEEQLELSFKEARETVEVHFRLSSQNPIKKT